MHRGLQFISGMAIGGLFIILCAGVVALLSMAPVLVQGGIASVYLGEPGQGVRISGHHLTCAQAPTIDRCTIQLEGTPLTLQVSYGDAERRIFHETARCEATYGDRPLGCDLHYYYGTGKLPILTIRESLGLSPSTLQRLYQDNFLIQFGGDNLLKQSTVIVVTCGVLAALSLSISSYPANPWVAIMMNGMAGLLGALMIRNPLHTLWGEWSLLVITGGAMAVGTIAWFCSRRVSRILYGFSGGLVITGFLWGFSLLLLILLGYAA
ncbi:hypothetical protein [Thermocoleostomius sinensis]|jgi:hypothetical protein|uniref:Uncharacterized protein n=1 Tax=Thermocoleostomius sinensis A174 TaxID=2016057 RepID=A0A9E8Z975_9CYAN|nr:hypothetical protein [Thermocoleostomius sinensis]WAL58843.1 hypothetical protein OXH18_16905 [Thermocoleostomius sinensis A174]